MCERVMRAEERTLSRPRHALAANGDVKVFISSIIGGFTEFREAARRAAEALGHQVIRAEDFPASSITPQQACLQGVREADVVLLIVGDRYGVVQPWGLSATHEEYREARERKPVMVFLGSGGQRKPAQQRFLDELEAWATGHFRTAFSSADELHNAVVRALHEHELAMSVGPVDEKECWIGPQSSSPGLKGLAILRWPLP